MNRIIDILHILAILAVLYVFVVHFTGSRPETIQISSCQVPSACEYSDGRLEVEQANGKIISFKCIYE